MKIVLVRGLVLTGLIITVTYCSMIDPMHSSQNLPHFWLTVHAINDQIVLNCDISHADESTFKKEISKANV